MAEPLLYTCSVPGCVWTLSIEQKANLSAAVLTRLYERAGISRETARAVMDMDHDAQVREVVRDHFARQHPSWMTPETKLAADQMIEQVVRREITAGPDDG